MFNHENAWARGQQFGLVVKMGDLGEDVIGGIPGVFYYHILQDGRQITCELTIDEIHTWLDGYEKATQDAHFASLK